MRCAVAVFSICSAACLANPPLESVAGGLDPLGAAYAVRVRSVVQVNHVDAAGNVLDGPYDKPFETTGVLFLDPSPTTPDAYAGRFRLCELTLPDGATDKVREDPIPYLPEFPLELQPDPGDAGWTIAPWAIVIGAELANPVTDPIDFDRKDPRARKLQDGKEGLRLSVTANWHGLDVNVDIDLVLRAVLSGGRLAHAADGSAALEGSFQTVQHTIWVLKANIFGPWDPSPADVMATIRARQAPWPTVGERHAVLGAPVTIADRSAIAAVCTAAAAAYPP